MVLCGWGKIHSARNSTVEEQADAVDNLVIPMQTNGNEYDAKQMSDKQKAIVFNAVDAVIKFLNNDPCYKPTRATIMGSAGIGKSFIINTNISVVRKLDCKSKKRI